MSKSTHHNVYFALSGGAWFACKFVNNLNYRYNYENIRFHYLYIGRPNTERSF